jgi:hypothetical protein
MRLLIVGGILVAACGNDQASAPSCRIADASLQVGVTHATVKVRDDAPVPAAQTIVLDAARNEFEPFQIVVNGGASGITDLHVDKPDFFGVRLYQEGRYFIRYASSTEGASGYWPDPLIPDVDAYAGEPRNAFVHFDVPANQTRAVWVELHVPADQAPGLYTETVTVSGTGLAPVAITVNLRVHTFALPSTASLPSAFGMSVDEVTRAHLGGQWCSDFPSDQTDALLMLYQRAALDHRISLISTTCGDPAHDLTTFDQRQGTLLDGTAPTQLAGARVQAFRDTSMDSMSTLAQHFAAKGWTGLVDYSCDEPPMACDEAAWPDRARAAHAAGIPNLVTTSYSYLQQKGWTDLVDILCPVAETVDDQSRADDDAFLALGPAKRLWWYQSCDSHGCGGCDAGMATYSDRQGMPSYVIDSDARQNRSMEWLSYIFGMQGELYYATTQSLAQGLDWDSGYAYCAFGGNGDGSFFYPGKASDPRIGGTTDFPLESIRLALVREGMEDYEYLRLYEQKFGRPAAVALARAGFPDVFGSKANPPELLYQVRQRIADALDDEPIPTVEVTACM